MKIEINKLIEYFRKKNFTLLEDGKEEVSIDGVIERLLEEEKKYSLLVDYGKPYEENFETEKELVKAFKEITFFLLEHEGEFGYSEIIALKENKDITEEIRELMLKEIEKNVE